MIKIIKGKWFPVAILVIVELSLLVFLYCNGFRITFVPDLENSWEAISAFAAWFGVVTSFGAIMVAIWIPKEIADRQDRIALFEKRLEIYNILSSCKTSVHIMEMADKIKVENKGKNENEDESEDEDILKYLFIIFMENPKEHPEFNRKEARLYLTNCSVKLRQATFFFPEEITSCIMIVAARLIILADSDAKIDGAEKYNKRKQNYIEAVKNLEKSKVFERIEAGMKTI